MNLKGCELREPYDSNHRWETREYSPCRYPEIGPLAAHLELKPLVEMVSLFECLICEGLFDVILLDDILYNGTRLPKSDICVRVLNS